MADTSSGRKMPAAPPIDWSRLKDYALKDSIPAGMIRSGIGALTLPGDVYAGRVDPNSNEGIARAADLAGTLTLGSGLAPGAADELRMGIKAYHGTPHDFDQFSMDKIGTGEGQQAYGHGLYFAENEGVAKGYRDALAKKGAIDPNADMLDPKRIAAELYDSWQGDIDGALSDAAGYDNPRAVRAALKALHANPPKGHMYEVDINADPEHFLDWDKPLSEQSEAVRKALGLKQRPTFEDQEALLQRLHKEGVPAEEMSGHPDVKAMYDMMDNSVGSPANPDVTGADYYRGTDSSLHGMVDPRDMARSLKERGIPGIRYRDAGSRTVLPDDNLQSTLADLDRQISNAKQTAASLPDTYRQEYDGHIADLTRQRAETARKADPTRNYVLFDDNLVNIARKYGLVGSAGLAGAAAASQAPSMAPQDSQALYAAGGAKRGGVINGYARGGSVSAGLINSDVPGRTDRLPMTVQVDSFVVPADIVSGFGQGNTKAGANLLDQIFQQHSGGSDDGGGQPTQIIAAGGEYVVPRAVVASIGNGDVAAGHKVLDNMVRTKRKEFAKHALSLPGPKK